MPAILFALALSASPSAPRPDGLLKLPAAGPSSAAACAALAETHISHYGKVPLKKLGDLPPGLPEHAVLREIGGCSVADVIYQGRTVYVIPQGWPGAGRPRIQPLTGEAQGR